MKTETVEARLNDITNCMAVFDEVKQSICLKLTSDDDEANEWLYKKLAILESRYAELLRLKQLTEKQLTEKQ